MTQWYKFYICKFTHKHSPTPRGMVWVKFGITHHMDVMKRFDPSVDDGYVKNYEDWNIKPDFSLKCEDKQKALWYENYYLHGRFPYNSKYKVWVEEVLGLEDRTKYNNTGITELRLIPTNEYYTLLKAMFNHKKELQNEQANMGDISERGNPSLSSSY